MINKKFALIIKYPARCALDYGHLHVEMNDKQNIYM